MPLHPDLAAFLDLANEGNQPPMWSLAPEEARIAYDQSSQILDTPGAKLELEDIALKCRDGHVVPMRLYRNLRFPRPQPLLLYFHGGGYVVGGLDSHDSLCRDLADYAGCAVLSVGYRLAPEHKFPTAFEDAADACDWLLQHGIEHGLDTSRVAYGGDSVGGTLATALCIRAKQQGSSQPSLQLLLYPCTSAHQNSPSHARYATGYLLEQQTLQWMFQHYLRHTEDRSDWRFAPLEAIDHSGLAPAHIVLAEFDPLVDEGLAYAERLHSAGVAVTAKVHHGMIHDFARLGNVFGDVQAFRAELASTLATALHPQSSSPNLGPCRNASPRHA